MPNKSQQTTAHRLWTGRMLKYALLKNNLEAYDVLYYYKL